MAEHSTQKTRYNALNALDCISRQAAIDAASYECGELRGVFGRIEERLKALPSAQPERRFDEWCKTLQVNMQMELIRI